VYHPPGTGQFSVLIAIHGNGTVAGQPVKAGEALYLPPNAEAFRVTAIWFFSKPRPELLKIKPKSSPYQAKEEPPGGHHQRVRHHRGANAARLPERKAVEDARRRRERGETPVREFAEP